MKKILLSIFLFINTLPVLSQPEFKIALDHIKWKNPADKTIVLEINLKITNISNTPGACEDLRGIWLYSSDAFYNYDIEFIEANKSILQVIKPGDHIFCYISFKVPKVANGLTLKFDEEHGGAEKFITDSYSKYELEDAEYSYTNKNYSDAIIKFKNCISIDASLRNDLYIKIADCYEKIGDKYLEEFNTYKAIENYKLCLNYDSKRSSVSEKIANLYNDLGDSEARISKLSAALILYKSSLEYNKSAVVSAKIDNINNKLLEGKNKAVEQKEIKIKWEEYDKLIKPTTGFTFLSGIGYHSNQNSSIGAPFWNLQMDVPIKLYTQKKLNSPINIFLNFEAGYSGFIGTESELFKYLGIKNNLFNLERNNDGPILGEYYLNGGIGISMLSQSLKPMLAIYYGVYGQSTSFDITSGNDYVTYYYKDNLSALHLGQGLDIELSLKIGSSFIVGYAFKSYNIESNIYFLKNNYTANYFNIGLSSF